jgi:hypothetical protein
MPAAIPASDVQRALTALGIAPQEFETIRRVPFPQAQDLLQELKAKARRNYKRLALELHPDRTQGDEAKATLFVLLGRVLEDLDKLRVTPPPPIPMQPAVFIRFADATPAWNQAMHVGGFPWVQVQKTWATNTATTTTTTSTTPVQQVIRIVKMRPR